MLPGLIWSSRPVRACSSLGIPHKGPGSRGTRAKHAMANGRPISSATPEVRNALRTGFFMSGSPSAAIAAQAAQPVSRYIGNRARDCRSRHAATRRISDTSVTTIRSRRLRTSSSLAAPMTSSSALPAPRPCSVRNDASVAAHRVPAMSSRSTWPGSRRRPITCSQCHPRAMAATARHQIGTRSTWSRTPAAYAARTTSVARGVTAETCCPPLGRLKMANRARHSWTVRRAVAAGRPAAGQDTEPRIHSGQRVHDPAT